MEGVVLEPNEFREAAKKAADWIAEYLRTVRDLPVIPDVKPGFLADALPREAPERGEPIDAILTDFERLIVPGTTHWNHPRFLAYFAISGSPPGILAEMLAASLNVQHMLWKTGPAQTELEQVTLGWLRQWLGLPEEFFGIIHDTASTATYHAILAAREQADPEVRRKGVRTPLTVYASEHAHSSVDKAVLGAGLGLDNYRRVPTDSEFRMRPDALAAMIEEDRAAGRKPCAIVATIGTTSAASVDPVPAITEVAQKYQVWLHVDAAYAGPAAVLDEYRHILNGVDHADSLVLNPHKWLFTPVDLSVFYTRRPDVMRRAVSLEEVPPYLTADDRAVNLADYSLALGRRFRSLKLWFVMRHYGREGIAAVLRSHMAVARQIAAEIAADPQFEVVTTAFSLVCFRYRGTDGQNRALLDRVNASGRAFLSGTMLNGQFVLRMAIGNLATTADDVLAAWDLIRRSALPASESLRAELPNPAPPR